MKPPALLSRLSDQLLRREKGGKLRSLTLHLQQQQQSRVIDFSSNDYLSIARNRGLASRIDDAVRAHTAKLDILAPVLGSTGSRLLTGNSSLCEETERLIAAFHGFEHALLANSGWDLNFGLLSCIPSASSGGGAQAEGTSVLFDELAHNSLVMGIRNGRQVHTTAFKHNDLVDLEAKLQECGGGSGRELLVVVESIYSMDGDTAPLAPILALCHKYGAMAVVDEAHSTGIVGVRGEGLVSGLGLQSHPSLLAVVYTFGKGLGFHGAALATQHPAVVGTMLNYCRPIVYSTSLPVPSLVALQCIYEEIGSQASSERRERLRNLTQLFRDRCDELALPILRGSSSPIQAVLFPGNRAVLAAAGQLLLSGFCCLPIRAPTVAQGAERLRIILHAHNSLDEVRELTAAIRDIGEGR